MRKKLVLILIVLFCGSLFFLRHPITAKIFETMVGPFEYESRSWEKSVLVYKNVRLGPDLAVGEVDVEWGLHFSPFYVEPRIFLYGPHLTLQEGPPSTELLAALLPQRWLQVKLDVEEGTIEIRKEGKSTYFSWFLNSDAEIDKMGRLFVCDAQGEFLSCNFEKEKETIRGSCDMAKRPLPGLAEFFSCFAPQLLERFEDLEGDVEAHAHLTFSDKLALKEVSAVLDLHNGAWVDKQSHIHNRIGHLEAELHCPFSEKALWKALRGSLTLEEGQMEFPSWKMDHLTASLVFKDENAEVKMTGSAVEGEKTLPLELIAQSVMQGEGPFLIEGRAAIGDSVAQFSLCQPNDDECVIQTELSAWNREASGIIEKSLDLFAIQLELPQGTFSGKCITSLYHGEISRVSWENIEASDVYLEWPKQEIQAYAPHLWTEGIWEKEKLEPSFSLKTKEAAIRYGEYDVSNLDLEIALKENQFETCKVLGVFKGKKVSMEGHGSIEEGALSGTLDLFPHLQIPFESIWKKEPFCWDFSGKAHHQSDDLEFGLSLTPSFAFKEGWFHTDKLNLSPWVENSQGHLQVFGTFSPEKIEGKVWSLGIEYLHPLFHLFLPQSEEEAHFTYHFTEGWELTAPLSHAKLEGKDLSFGPIHGTLHLNEKEGHLDHLQAICEGVQLQGKLDFFSMGPQVFDIHLCADAIEGKMEDVATIFSRLTKTSPIEGEILGHMTSGKNGFHLFYHHTPQAASFDWRISAKVHDIAYPAYSIQNLHCSLDYDSSADVFVLSSLHGEAGEYHFSSEDFRYKDSRQKECEFDCRVEKKGEEVAKVDRIIIRFQEEAFDLQGSGLSIGKKAVYPLHFKGKKVGSQWVLEKGQVGDLFLSGSFSQAELRFKEYRLRGNLQWEGKDLSISLSSIEGLPYRGKSESRFLATLFPSPKIQNLSLVFFDDACEVCHLSTDLLAYQSQTEKWHAEEVHIQVNKGDEPFKGVFAVKLAPSYLNLQGVVQQGRWEALRAKELYGLYEAPFLNLKCHGLYKDLPLHFILRVNGDKNWAGQLQIEEPHSEEELTLSLGPHASVEKIEGTLHGLEAHLAKSGEYYKGEVKLLQGSQAALFHDSLQKCSNLKLAGLWKKEPEGVSFQGELIGKDFAYNHEIFKELHADVQMSPSHVALRNLSIIDHQMSLLAKQIRCDKHPTTGAWSLDIPLIKAQNIHPNAKKPFHIRHLVLSDLHAILGDATTFRAQGSFNFTNAYKREDSIFDIPKELLKDLGLDLSLLTPTSGEVEYQLRGEKVFLTALKNTFSEGKRCQFFLPSDVPPSTIDLDGNLNLSLRVKQDVILKWAQPFILSVTGSFSQPKYSLK